jgi:hypothetical protein
MRRLGKGGTAPHRHQIETRQADVVRRIGRTIPAAGGRRRQSRGVWRSGSAGARRIWRDMAGGLGLGREQKGIVP